MQGIFRTEETGEENTRRMPAFYGGGSIELRLSRWFGIQTGLNVLSDHVPYTPRGKEEQYEKMITWQIPVLARLNLQLSEPGLGGPTIAGIKIAAFGGLGLNVATTTSDAESIDPARMNFIAGGEFGLNWPNFELLFGYQWNGGIGSGSITVDGASYDYTQGIHTLYAGIRIYVPFKSK